MQVKGKGMCEDEMGGQTSDIKHYENSHLSFRDYRYTSSGVQDCRYNAGVSFEQCGANASRGTRRPFLKK